MTATMPPPPQPTETKKPKGTSAIKVMIGVFLGLVLFTGGCLAVFSAGVDNAIEDIEFEQYENENATIDASTITECGPGDTPNQYGGTLEFVMPFDEPKAWVQVNGTLLDSEGVVVESWTVIFQNIQPGQTARQPFTALIIDHAADYPDGLTCEMVEATAR